MWVGGVHIATDGHGGGGLFDASGEIGRVDDMEERTGAAALAVQLRAGAGEAGDDGGPSRVPSSLFPMFHSIVDIHSPGIPAHLHGRIAPRSELEPLGELREGEQGVRQPGRRAVQEGDLVWVHNLADADAGYRNAKSLASRSASVHQPWPSSELFRTLTRREEILRGMLNSDIIGFHSFDFARNFLCVFAAARARLLREKGSNLTLDYNGRHIDLHRRGHRA